MNDERSPEQETSLDTEEDGSLRMCIVSRKRLPPEQMLRFVVSPQTQRVHLDYLQKLPGRGAYLYPERETLRLAVEKRAFHKAFRSEVIAEQSALLEEIQQANARQIVSLLSLAFRASKVEPGNSRVEDALRHERGLLLLLARDASEGVKQKFRRWAERLPIPWLEILSKEQLGPPLRLPECSLLVVTEQGFAAKLHREAERAQAFHSPEDEAALPTSPQP